LRNQKEILISITELISKNLINAEQTLTELDSHIGDGDCGIGIRKGFEAVLRVIPELYNLDIGDILKKIGFTLAYTIGGTSGAMLGTGFIELGKALKDNKEPSIYEWIDAAKLSLEAVKRRGGNTQKGDKTMIDALEPSIESMINSIDTGKEVDLERLFDKAATEAEKGSDSTINVAAKKGRASYLGERSIGFRDPGSLVITIIMKSVAQYFKTI